MNIFEALRESHVIQRNLAEQLLSTSGDTPERRELFERLKNGQRNIGAGTGFVVYRFNYCTGIGFVSPTSAQPKPIAGFRLGGCARFTGHVAGPTHTPTHQSKTLSCVLFNVLIDVRLAAAAEALVLNRESVNNNATDN